MSPGNGLVVVKGSPEISAVCQIKTLQTRREWRTPEKHSSREKKGTTELSDESEYVGNN